MLSYEDIILLGEERVLVNQEHQDSAAGAARPGIDRHQSCCAPMLPGAELLCSGRTRTVLGAFSASPSLTRTHVPADAADNLILLERDNRHRAANPGMKGHNKHWGSQQAAPHSSELLSERLYLR